MVKHIQAERKKGENAQGDRREKALRERMSGLFTKPEIKGMTNLVLYAAHNQPTPNLTSFLINDNKKKNIHKTG